MLQRRVVGALRREDPSECSAPPRLGVEVVGSCDRTALLCEHEGLVEATPALENIGEHRVDRASGSGVADAGEQIVAATQLALRLLEVAGEQECEADVHRVDAPAQRETELLDERPCVCSGRAGPREVAAHGEQQCTNVERERLVRDVGGVAAEEDVAEGNPGLGRRGPPGDRTQPRDEGRALESRVAGLPRELGRPLEVGLALAGPAEHEAGHPDLPVRPCEIGKVTGELECRGDLECLAQLVLDLRRRDRPWCEGG